MPLPPTVLTLSSPMLPDYPAPPPRQPRPVPPSRRRNIRLSTSAIHAPVDPTAQAPLTRRSAQGTPTPHRRATPAQVHATAPRSITTRAHPTSLACSALSAIRTTRQSPPVTSLADRRVMPPHDDSVRHATPARYRQAVACQPAQLAAASPPAHRRLAVPLDVTRPARPVKPPPVFPSDYPALPARLTRPSPPDRLTPPSPTDQPAHTHCVR